MSEQVKRIRQLPGWLALVRHRRAMETLTLSGLFERDPHRFTRFSVEHEGLLLDYSKHRISGETMDLLLTLARQADLEGARGALFAGGQVNRSEGRPALHTALRDPDDTPLEVAGEDLRKPIRDTAARMAALVDEVRDGRYTGVTGKSITDVVNIGIGGSDLGPRLAVEALSPWADGPRVHFVANVDGVELAEVFRDVDPERTLFLVVSKSFGTPETMTNAEQAMDWFRARVDHADGLARHFLPITANVDRVIELGLDPERVLPMWDWVGGRYSLWSAVGLSLAMAVGSDRFRALLDGAHAMDRHFLESPLERNIPVVLGLLSIWNVNVLGLRSQAIISYTERLARLPAYLQQLIMESNGKSVDRDGVPLEWGSAPVVWGQTGTVAQHAFFQALHQGTETVPVDFIGVAADLAEGAGDSAQIAANLFAQSRALMTGRSADALRAEMADMPDAEALAAARACPGDRPSTTILLRDLTPFRLGMLLAMYEHRTFVEGHLWGVNSFDQWGVELGKVLANDVASATRGETELPDADASTQGLVQRFMDWRR